MPVETATTINQLDVARPGVNDLKSEGDDHLRLLKSTIKNTFPNITGVVTATQAQLNGVSPVFTGTPTAPNPTRGSSTTQIATTTFVMDVALPAATAYGAYALVSPPVDVALNGVIGGSSIFLSGGNAAGWAASSVSLLGTWRCMGGSGTAGRVSAGEYGLFQRIA
jgi:hypothetical protein